MNYVQARLQREVAAIKKAKATPATPVLISDYHGELSTPSRPAQYSWPGTTITWKVA